MSRSTANATCRHAHKAVHPKKRAGEQLPVTLDAPGWTCAPPGDEKFICSQRRASVVITLRPARDYDAYLHDPDKASPSQYVSALHGGVFATITPGPGANGSTTHELGRSLLWK